MLCWPFRRPFNCSKSVPKTSFNLLRLLAKANKVVISSQVLLCNSLLHFLTKIRFQTFSISLSLNCFRSTMLFWFLVRTHQFFYHCFLAVFPNFQVVNLL